MQHFFSIRSIVLFGMFLLALLALALARHSALTYQEFAFENRLGFERDIMILKSRQIIDDVHRRQLTVARELEAEAAFRGARAQGDYSTLSSWLRGSFTRIYEASGKLRFKTLSLRDADGEVLAIAHENVLLPYHGCPVLIDRIGLLTATDAAEAEYALCSFGDNVYAEAMVPLGPTRAEGYLHLVAHVVPELQKLEREILDPIQLRFGKTGPVLYQSSNWVEADPRQQQLRQISQVLYGDDNVAGLQISGLHDFSNFISLSEKTNHRLMLLTIAIAAVVFLLVVALLKLAFRPLENIGASVGELLTGTYAKLGSEGVPKELTELVDVYNQLVEGMEDASARRREAERDLISQRDFISTTLDSITNAVIVVNSRLEIQLVNPAAENLLGDYEEHLRGGALDELVIFYSNRSATHISNLRQLLKTPQQLANLFIERDGNVTELEMMASPMVDKDSEDVGHVLVFKDVTEDRKLRRKLSYEGRHDKLTGFLNRPAFERKFETLVGDSDYTRNQHIMVYLNLDQFKVVNDTCGNAAGDELLLQVAGVLRSNVRKSDLMARLGGDEFGLLLPFAEAEAAANTVNDILAYINQTGFSWEGHEFTITASAALIPFGLARDDYSEKLAKLTTARMIAKDNGGNQYYLIGDDDEKVQQHHSSMGWASGINKGFAENRFKLYAQPIVPLNQREEVRHYEILIRYRDEDDTIIRPGEFLLPAERFNLIEKIDRWVVTEVVRWLADHKASGPEVKFSINLSGRSIGSSSFHRFLIGILESEAVDATNLCFEITETAAVHDVEKSIEFIRVIKSLGAKFSLDDFGSGLSSFTYLKQFPVDYLKIDGVFIKDIIHDSESYAFVRSITEVGHCLGMKVIAEFVESKHMFHTLREAKVDYLQGYTIGEPRPIDEIENT